MNLSLAYRKMRGKNGATAAWVLTFDPLLKQNKKKNQTGIQHPET